MSIRDPLTFSDPKRVDASTVSPNIRCGLCDHRALLHPSRDNRYKTCDHPSCKCIGFIVAGFLSQTASTRPEASAIPEPADPRAAALHGFCAAKGIVLYPRDQFQLLAAIDKADPIRRITDTSEPLQAFVAEVYDLVAHKKLDDEPDNLIEMYCTMGLLSRAVQLSSWDNVYSVAAHIAALAAQLAILGDSSQVRPRLDKGLDSPRP